MSLTSGKTYKNILCHPYLLSKSKELGEKNLWTLWCNEIRSWHGHLYDFIFLSFSSILTPQHPEASYGIEECDLIYQKD